jgi:protein-disulfide isomerase
MLIIVALLRIALSAVFGVAGVTKLLDQRGTREAVRNFGVPEALAPTLTLLLPLVELAIAAGLFFSKTAGVSAIAALLLLAMFVAAIGVNLARGNTHDCHCFGQLYSRPLGWSTLVRNIVFVLGAGFVLWQESREASGNIFESLAQINLAQWLLLISVVVIAAAIWALLQRRRQRSAMDTSATPVGLPVDSIAPPFDLDAYEGGRRSLTQLLDQDKPLLLIFTNPKCGPCIVLFKEIKDWQHSHSDKLTIALLSKGTIKENFVNVARNRLGQVLLQQEREVAEQYGATVTPTAVVISPKGRIASPLAAGADQIRELLHTVLGNSHSPNNNHHPTL